MIDNRLVEDIQLKLKPLHFFEPLHGRIYEAILRITDSNRIANPVTLKPLFEADEGMKEVGGPAIVFTFDPHPVRLLRPKEAPPPLTWTDRKAELLNELGVDAMIAYPTDEALLALSPQDFFSRIVGESLENEARQNGTVERFLNDLDQRNRQIPGF